MVELPPVAPQVGLTARVRLGRDISVHIPARMSPACRDGIIVAVRNRENANVITTALRSDGLWHPRLQACAAIIIDQTADSAVDAAGSVRAGWRTRRE